MSPPNRMAQRIHFEDFGGTEFERLVFAYHVRSGWTDVAWFGQGGTDQGRDIIGNEPLDDGTFRKTIVQCVNRSVLTQKKAEEDMQKASVATSGEITGFKFVARGNVSAIRRDAIEAVARNFGFDRLKVWSGVDFEEHLRLIGEDLLRRFCAGEVFPDDKDQLTRFADDFSDLSDEDALQMMAAVFDRPAFRTPFHQESSLPAFQQAIEDTIRALNTGVWRTREGDEIKRIPSWHHLRDAEIKSKVGLAVQIVDDIRRAFVSGLKNGTIRPCGCNQPDCPIFMIEPNAARLLDATRNKALNTFRVAYPKFNTRVE